MFVPDGLPPSDFLIAKCTLLFSSLLMKLSTLKLGIGEQSPYSLSNMNFFYRLFFEVEHSLMIFCNLIALLFKKSSKFSVTEILAAVQLVSFLFSAEELV